MDNFKQLNDSYGHVTGDLFIKEIDGVFKQPYDPLISRPELEAMNLPLSLGPYSDNHSTKIKAVMSAENYSRAIQSFSSMAMSCNTHAALASAGQPAG